MLYTTSLSTFGADGIEDGLLILLVLSAVVLAILIFD